MGVGIGIGIGIGAPMIDRHSTLRCNAICIARLKLANPDLLVTWENYKLRSWTRRIAMPLGARWLVL